MSMLLKSKSKVGVIMKERTQYETFDFVKKIKDDDGNVKSFPSNPNHKEEEKNLDTKIKRIYPTRVKTFDGDEHM